MNRHYRFTDRSQIAMLFKARVCTRTKIDFFIKIRLLITLPSHENVIVDMSYESDRKTLAITIENANNLYLRCVKILYNTIVKRNYHVTYGSIFTVAFDGFQRPLDTCTDDNGKQRDICESSCNTGYALYSFKLHNHRMAHGYTTRFSRYSTGIQETC